VTETPKKAVIFGFIINDFSHNNKDDFLKTFCHFFQFFSDTQKTLYFKQNHTLFMKNTFYDLFGNETFS